MLNLILVRPKGNQSYLSCIDEIEHTLAKKQNLELKVINSNSTRFKNLLLKILIPFASAAKKTNKVNFSVAMGPTFAALLPSFLKQGNNFLYMYDAWPRFHAFIAKVSTCLRIKAIFFSSEKAALMFNALNCKTKGFWIPEAIKADDYYSMPYSEKTIDVLEFGRKYEPYHNKIADILLKKNRVHLFEQQKGQVIFNTRKEFADGLSKSKISICIPSNITHPERAENISSMTLRYLQSMASKCLIVGMMPQEMHQLFDYMPIIEIDYKRPGEQLLEILNNYEAYQPLIDKNFEVVAKFHTWETRFDKIFEIIKNESAAQ